MKDKILSYLASGLKASEVASILGCNPSYISNLMKDELFLKELEDIKVNQPANAEEVTVDNRYLSLETQILKRMSEAILDAELPAMTRALEVVAKVRDMRFQRKNPALTNPLGSGGNYTIVNLTLPVHALPPATIELNTQKEILSLNGKAMAPMSSDSVKGLFDSIKNKATIAQDVPSKELAGVPNDF